MLRRRLKFQTKIMLAVMVAVVLVTVAVMALTENKIRSSYRAAAESHFSEQVDGITEMRRSRMDGAGRFLERMSEIPAVIRIFEEDRFGPAELAEVKREVKQILNETSGPPGRPGGRMESDRLICLVNNQGKLFPVHGLRIWGRAGKKEALDAFAGSNNFNSRQSGFLLVAGEEVKPTPLEVVVSPVETAGVVRGAILTGLAQSTSDEGFGSKRQDQKQPSPQRRNPMLAKGLLSGLYLEGELFFDDSTSESDEAAIKASVSRLVSGESEIEHVELGDESYQVFIGNLTSDGATLPPSYQVVLYPINDLLSDLRDLRYKGSGIGIAAILFGMLIAWLLSRNLARPIIELEKGTTEISRGNFQARVAPRGNDEIGALARSFNEMAEGLEMREQLRDVLGKVSDSTVAQALIEGNLELGGEMREVSVLFCDIRGFTAMTETMPPSEVIELINHHMTAMTEVVYRHKGVIDKFVGDEVMAVFGAPKSYGKDAKNAVSCAQEMLKVRAEMNRSAARPIEVGVGVATGEVIVGCMGSVDRLNYTVLGERVNRASRLCGIAAPGEAIVDDTTIAKSGVEACEELPPVELKGYSAPLTVFRLVAKRLAGVA